MTTLEAVEATEQAIRQFKGRQDQKMSAFEGQLAALDDKIDQIRLSGAGGKGVAAEAEPKRLGGGDTGPIMHAAPAVIRATEEQAADWERFLRRGERAASMVKSDEDGGFLVQPFTSSKIHRTLFETSPIRALCRSETLDQGDAFQEPQDRSEASANWVGETESRVDTDQGELALFRVPLHEIYAQPSTTQKLLDTSSFNVDAWLSRKVADKFSRAENTAFISGDGDGKPRGLLSYPTSNDPDSTRAWGTIEYIPSGASGAFAADPDGLDAFETMLGQMKVPYRGGLVWLMNRRTFAAVRKLKDSEGRPHLPPDYRVGGIPTLLGYPIVLAEDMPDLSADSLSVALVNLGESYIVVDHQRGMSVLRDPFTNKPYVRFYTTKLVGGDVFNFESIKLMKMATS